MIFDLTKNYVPDVYKESRDYRVFLRILSILVSTFKNNIDSFPSLYSADDCPDALLPLLASLVGYEYDEGLSVYNNRIIIKYFPLLLRYRGSEQGIKLAIALSLNTSEDADAIYTLSNIIITYDYENGVIKIYYPYTDLINKDLIEVVRPVGMVVQFIPSGIGTITEELELKATVRMESNPYNTDDTKVDKSKVGFGENYTDPKDIPDT